MALRDEGIHFQAKFAGDKLHLLCEGVEDFRLAQRYLQQRRVDFHTFTLKAEAEVKAILRGIHHSTDPSVISNELKAEGFEPTYVTSLPRRHQGEPVVSNSFFVKLKKTGSWAKLWDLKLLFGVRVTFSPFEPRRGLPQCYRCQRFGHSSVNCNLPLRCVKCAGEHDAKQCSKTREQPPKCCNCQGEHVASWKGCKSHKEAMEAKRRREAPKPTRGTRSPRSAAPKPAKAQRPSAQSNQAARPPKPPGTNRGTFAQAVSGGANRAPPKNPPGPPAPVPLAPTVRAEPHPTAPSQPTGGKPAPPKERRRKRKPRNKENRATFVAGSEADGDESGMETDAGHLVASSAGHPTSRLPDTPKPTAPAVRRPLPQPRAHVQVTPRPTNRPTNEQQGMVSVQKLIVWMTKAIPTLISAKDKSPAEMIAELLQSLLTLLQDD